MNRIYLFFLLFTVTFLGLSSDNNLIAKDKKTRSLINSKNFEVWRGVNKSDFPKNGWKTENGVIICTGEKGGDIITLKEYSNFELIWKWKMLKPGSNSGIKYFVKERPGDSGGYGFGIEYQMLDDNDYISRGQMKPNDYHTTGSAYELYPPNAEKKVKPLGKWNKSKIISNNGKIEHWLNGCKILEFNRFSDDFKHKIAQSKFKNVGDFGLHQTGHILLQDHDSEIIFRKLKIK